MAGESSARRKKGVSYILKLAIGLGAAFLALWFFLNWQTSNRKQRELLAWIHVSVADIDNSNPPALKVHVENRGLRTVGRTHFRLVFSADGKDAFRADVDYGAFTPGEKRTILLKSKDVSEAARPHFQTKLNYYLLVFPEYRKPLPPLEGDIVLK